MHFGSDHPAIRVRDVGVTYRIVYQGISPLRERIVHLGRVKRHVRDIRALRGLTFDVPQGSVLGVIGSNGAGKTTLLRAIAGIIPPTSGEIEVRGRVSALLALGVGFNKNLSGRENVVLGGLAAGRDLAEIKQQYDSIVEFADLGEFMDLPMRTYSSGMYGRLAFAVAVFLDPDILLLDEALSTGDAAFKQKSIDKMTELRERAGTILLVSHGLSTVRDLATECLWLDKGRFMARGNPDDIIDEYTEFTKTSRAVSLAEA